MANANQPNLTELMQTAQKMQEGMRKAQEELARKEVEGVAGSEPIIVRVIMNGRHEIVRIFISDDAMSEGKEVLADLIIAAAKKAKDKIEDESKKLMMNLSKNLGLPPDFELPTGE